MNRGNIDLLQLLVQQAEVTPKITAIVNSPKMGAEEWTFLDMAATASHVAALIKASGLKPGQSALLLHPVSAELYVLLLALLHCRITAIIVDPGCGIEHMEKCFSAKQPDAIIGCPAAMAMRTFNQTLRSIPNAICINGKYPGCQSVSVAKLDGAALRLYHVPRANQSTDAPHGLLTFTSGSTGIPKAILRDEEFLFNQYTVLKDSLNLQAGQIHLTTMPIFILANLAAGVTTVLPDRNIRRLTPRRCRRILRQLSAYNVTQIVAAPSFFEQLADFCIGQDRIIPEIQQIFTGGAPVFPRVIDKLERVAPWARVTCVYGSSEAEPIAQIDHQTISIADRQFMEQGKGLLVGKVSEHLKLAIITGCPAAPHAAISKKTFERLAAGPGIPGEIVVAGYHVVKHYLNEDSETTTKFWVENERWHRTGDAGYVDDEGRLWLLGRSEARIKNKASILYPFAVEAAAMNLSHVKRAALVQTSDAAVLLIQPRRILSFREKQVLTEWLGNLPIQRLQIVPHIPMDKRHNSKVDYNRVRQLYQAQSLKYRTRSTTV